MREICDSKYSKVEIKNIYFSFQLVRTSRIHCETLSKKCKKNPVDKLPGENFEDAGKDEEEDRLYCEGDAHLIKKNR